MVSLGAGFGSSDACALKYCNAWVDLKNAFCDGTECYSAAQAGACLHHYNTVGEAEGRTPDPTVLCAEAGVGEGVRRGEIRRFSNPPPPYPCNSHARRREGVPEYAAVVFQECTHTCP